jgi:hypothetical protein
MINKINKEIENYIQLNKDYIILLQNKENINSILNPYYHDEYLSYTNYNYTFNNSISYNNYINIKNNNKIPRQSIQLLSYLSFINIKKILVISHNIYFILPILYNKLNNNYKITFIVINTVNIDQIIYLKNTYNELIDIYYIGFNYDYESYNTILSILKNDKFSTIIIDYGRTFFNYEKCVVIGLLILDKFLSNDGCFIDYFILHSNLNDRILKFMNLVYNCFYNHNSNDTTITWDSRFPYPDNMYIYNNIKSRLINDVKEKLINFLKNDILDDSIINFELTDNFLQNLYIRWFLFRTRLEENYKRLQHILINKNNKRINFKYHQNKINDKNIINIIPKIIDDIPYINKQIDNVYLPTSSFKDKSLLLLYIQVLTKCNNVTNIILYSSSKNNFLPILYNLFPNITWYINKHEKNSENIFKHPDKNKVILYKDTKELNLKAPAAANTDDKKTLFISNYYDKNISKIENMKNQANLGTNLNADYLLINIYLLNDNEKLYVDYPKKYSDLNFKNISNIELFTTFNFLFLKGEILLDLYSSVKKLKLNLFIEKKNNLFELNIYDFVSLYNKLLYYNIFVKTSYSCSTNNGICKQIPLEYISLLPGYDTSLECIMEYQIISNFFQKCHSISDTKIIVNKMFDINSLLEKLSKKYFIMSIHRTVTKQLNNTSVNDYDKYVRLYYWKNISLYNISFSAKYQIDYITNNGNKIYTEERIEQCINYLKQFIQKKQYYNLKNKVL